MAGFTNDIMNADNVNFTGSNPTVGSVTTNGQLLIGASTGQPIRVGTLTEGANIGVTNGTGSISLRIRGTTNNAVQVGNSSGALTSLSVGASNSVLQGSTGADPAFTTTPRVDSITFDGTNNLANYATALWTPNLQIGGSSVGITYSSQVGGYTRIGNTVNFWFFIALSSKGATVGNVTISNFPIATSTNGIFQFIPISQFKSFTAAGYTIMAVQLAASSAVGTLIVSGSGLGPVGVPNTTIANDFSISCNGMYILD